MVLKKEFMTKTRRIISAAALGLVLSTPQSFAATEQATKVSVVDSGKILQMLPETKKAEAALQTASAPLEKELDRLNQELQKSVATYRQQAGSLSKTVRDQREKELNAKAKAVEKYQQENFGRGGTMEKKQQELLVPIRQKVLTAVQAIAENEGVTLVLEKNSAIYVTPDNDITFKVLDKLNLK